MTTEPVDAPLHLTSVITVLAVSAVGSVMITGTLSVQLFESVTVKLMFIGILILVLLIPSSMINNLIDERAERQQEVIKDVSYNFAGSQMIKGPVLVIPYKIQVNEIDNNEL